MKIKRHTGDYITDAVIYAVLILLAVVTLYPFLTTLAISFNDADDTARGGITVFPRSFTIENYKVIFTNQGLFQSYAITVLRTLIGGTASTFMTGMFAYGMSKSHLKGRKVYMALCVVSMYFSGGLIPFYLLIKNLHLTNNFLVYIIPNLISVYNMIIMMTYFRSIPPGLEESAKIDGANQLKIFTRIILPVSAPIIATIALFNGVFQWNSWFDASLYITKQNLKPVQSLLISIIDSSRFQEALAKAGLSAEQLGRSNKINVRSITMSTIVVTILPIVMAYPFLQKYFIKGIMIGSIKG